MEKLVDEGREYFKGYSLKKSKKSLAISIAFIFTEFGFGLFFLCINKQIFVC